MRTCEFVERLKRHMKCRADLEAIGLRDVYPENGSVRIGEKEFIQNFGERPRMPYTHKYDVMSVRTRGIRIYTMVRRENEQ